MSNRISWWEAAFSSEISWREREAINSTADTVDHLAIEQDELHRRVAVLTQRVAAQEQVIKELRAVLRVVVDAFGEPGGNRDLLEARIETALDSARPVAPAAVASAAGDAYRGGPQGSRSPALGTCVRCSIQEPAADMFVTAVGSMCRQCVGA
jgi:hypothetical protein